MAVQGCGCLAAAEIEPYRLAYCSFIPLLLLLLLFLLRLALYQFLCVILFVFHSVFHIVSLFACLSLVSCTLSALVSFTLREYQTPNLAEV